MIWLSRLLDKSVPVSEYAEEAWGWRSCAVGEFHAELPQFRLLDTDSLDDAPLNRCLLRWGERFGSAIAANDRETALQLYRRMFNYITKGGVKK